MISSQHPGAAIAHSVSCPADRRATEKLGYSGAKVRQNVGGEDTRHKAMGKQLSSGPLAPVLPTENWFYADYVLPSCNFLVHWTISACFDAEAEISVFLQVIWKHTPKEKRQTLQVTLPSCHNWKESHNIGPLFATEKFAKETDFVINTSAGRSSPSTRHKP